VTLVTPAPLVSYWTQYTLEQERIETRLRSLGVRVVVRETVARIEDDRVVTESVLDGRERSIPRDHVVLVGDRAPETSLYDGLASALVDGRLESLRLVGDADAPGLIAHAVFAGHLAAREFGTDVDPDIVPFRRERFALP
jgi:dimethylamine/trimethylamine dehydrogenase